MNRYRLMFKTSNNLTIYIKIEILNLGSNCLTAAFHFSQSSPNVFLELIRTQKCSERIIYEDSRGHQIWPQPHLGFQNDGEQTTLLTNQIELIPVNGLITPILVPKRSIYDCSILKSSSTHVTLIIWTTTKISYTGYDMQAMTFWMTKNSDMKRDC